MILWRSGSYGGATVVAKRQSTSGKMAPPCDDVYLECFIWNKERSHGRSEWYEIRESERDQAAAGSILLLGGTTSIYSVIKILFVGWGGGGICVRVCAGVCVQ